MTAVRIVVLALAVLVVAGCEPVAPTTAQAGPPSVVYFGDSNVAMVAGQLTGTVHATAGYSLDDWFADMATVPAGSVVVVALGSNDVLEDDVAGDVAEAARLLERRCVVWVTPAQTSFDAMGEPFTTRAAGLIAEVAAHTHVVVWAPPTDLLQPTDPVHLTAAGYEQYAAVLAAAPGECRP
jgi:hypothetical protein